MSCAYFCRHCGERHETHGEMALRVCGCDGERHDACRPRRAPAGTPRPERWPAYLTWETAV
ncbi:hypothetical protein AN218_04630 [Streptomyces nanshensis]|uniref:Uncharacterized protein n=1 Tax=Streptomyces nanshensis TaxID=518642 RepID=A0A1E7LAI5_9ACTN|nr:hypothetical protein AN218_04630 [Streptomyces nanshensis]